MEFIPDKLKKVLFIIIGICNFIVIPVVLLIFSGKRDWYGILYTGLMSIFFSLVIIVSYRRFTVPKIIENHLIPRNKKSYYHSFEFWEKYLDIGGEKEHDTTL